MTDWLYRARQFRQALTAKPTRADMAEVRRALPDTLFALFTRLQPSEKAHALAVYRRVKQESEDPDLLTAALLHDIGKIIQPLALWERVLIVLVQNLPLRKIPGPPDDGKSGSRPAGWTRALVVAEKHPIWGAQLARRAGASVTTVHLIRRHQESLAGPPESREERLLKLLQEADDVS